ncbi:hypothetical protein STCU_07348 [Strigomonas culicis]|uniref:Uncharacterized protein n=1 Tax=Strigomonas culicis TaxID=28005 RepID=S9VAL9_9TRYP|nr:hypothetical protein STCU_07348 [Strigomonas culicis]|eukprot:EPY24046.1 hypothetical protein STCU_07348 [Strigomonas culicis]
MLANPSGRLGQTIRSLFSFDAAKWRPSLLSLAPPCQLFGYRLPAEKPSPSSAGGPVEVEERYGFLGLLSLDQIDTREPKPQRLLERMENYIRVKCNVEVPLVEEATRNESVRTAVYRRAFTPDGVPIIDRCGASYNTYVCSGFGDHGPDFAPGAARIVSKLVEEYANRLHADTIDVLATQDAALAQKASVVPPRVEELQGDLRHLFNGVLPPRRPAAGAAGGGGLSEHLPRWAHGLSAYWFSPSCNSPVRPIAALKQELDKTPVPRAAVPNPYSTSRFGDLVKTHVRDTHHVFVFDRLFLSEDEVMKWTEPFFTPFCKFLTQHAMKDDTSFFVKT